jgi:hypothetical protein
MSCNNSSQAVSNRLLVVVLTSCLVASDTINFFTVCLCATLRGFLGGGGKSASRLDGFSTTAHATS